MKIAMIGLGEAGSKYAAAMVEQGHEVVGCDPAPNETPAGVRRVDGISEAVSGVDMVCVMTGAAVAEKVARSALDHVREGTVYADFTTASPGLMAQLEGEFEPRGVAFADVAILGPIPTTGAQTPLMVSGKGGSTVAAVMGPIGANVTALDEPAGAAMAHKLLRSVFMKSLATVIWEATAAGRAAGYEEWIRQQIAKELAGDGQAVIDRLLKGTRTHAARRSHEMSDTGDYLESMGVDPLMTRASQQWHEKLRDAEA